MGEELNGEGLKGEEEKRRGEEVKGVKGSRGSGVKGRRCEEVTGTVVKGRMGEIVKEGNSEGDKSIRCGGVKWSIN
jgi:hypothetical protein